MWMLHGIFRAISERKQVRFCWRMHVSTEIHGKVLNIIESFNSDVHEATNPVIEESSM